MTFVPGWARRITSDTESAGLGDKPASNRITSAGVPDAAPRVCWSVSVWATTSRSFSSANILPIPTRKMASESATISRTGVRLGSTLLECEFAPGRRGGRSISCRGICNPECSEALELVLIDDNRHAPAARFFITANHSALAIHQDIAIGTQYVSGHGNREFHDRAHLNFGLRAEENSAGRNVNCFGSVFLRRRLQRHLQV